MVMPVSLLAAREQIGWCAVAERLVRALVVVEMEVAVQRLKQVGAIDEVAGVDPGVSSAFSSAAT